MPTALASTSPSKTRRVESEQCFWYMSESDNLLEPQEQPLSNWEAIAQIQRFDDRATLVYSGGGAALLTGLVISNPVLAFIALPTMAVMLKRVQKAGQLLRNMTAILETFEDQGVEVFPLLKVDGQEPLDLFVRFPSKQFFAIALRSIGKANVIYDEDEEALYFRYREGKRGLKRWRPDHLRHLSDQEFWLRKNRRDLFGGSSRDSRRPIAKVLVLTGTGRVASPTGETRLIDHSEHLYVKISDQRFLSLRRRSTTYVIEEEQLTEFIKAWLAQQSQQG